MSDNIIKRLGNLGNDIVVPAGGTFVVLQVAPTIKTASGKPPTTTQANEVLGAALRQVGNHTTRLSDLQRALDDGVEVYLLRVAVNGVSVMDIKLVR